MTVSSEPTIAALVASYRLGNAHVRPFGQHSGDLDVDFNAPRALVTTQLLARCLGDIDTGALWELPITARLLLLVASSELAMPPIELYLACSCGETAELQLTARELADFAAERGNREPSVDGIRLRRPTGRDQLRWTALAASDGTTELARRMLAELIVEGPHELDDELIPRVDRELAEVDPLIEFRVDTQCPACGQAIARDVDLEAIGLSRLQHVQRMLIEDIHVIASAYHWSEDHVVRMPAWRRDEYRALLGRSRA